MVRGVRGRGKSNFFTGGRFFLPGERNLRRSDFDQLKSELIWPKFTERD